MEGELTFTIGKGFGQMLQRIAWEKLTEKYNPREAVEIITKSLPGCTEGMAVDILDGKIILGEDEATQEVLGSPGAGGKFNDWIRAQRVLLEEEAKEWVKSLEGIRQEIAEAGGKFEFSVRYPELISYLSGDKDAGLLDYPRSNVVEEIKGVVEGANGFFVRVGEVYEVIVWMCDALNKSRVILPDPILSMHTILDSLCAPTRKWKPRFGSRTSRSNGCRSGWRNEKKIKPSWSPWRSRRGTTPGGCRPMANSTASTGARETCSTSTSPNGCSRPKRFQSKRCGIRIAGWKRTAG